MRRMRLKRKKSFGNKTVIIILLIIMVYLSLKMISNKITPILLNYAENETRRIANIIVSKAVDEEILKVIDDNFFLITRENNEIKSIDFDPVKLNKFLTKIIDKVQMNLKLLEVGDIDKLDLDNSGLVYYDKEKIKKGIFYEIPMGVVFNNTLLANLGPKIPVKFTLMGEVISNLETKITDYGINNALIETSINLKLTEKVLLPISSKSIDVEYNIPLSIKMLQGSIPEYYFNGLESKSIVVPVE